MKDLYQFNAVQNSNSGQDDETVRRENASVMARYLSKGSTANVKTSPIPQGFERLMDVTTEVGISKEALFITELLNVNENKRLGSGVKGPRHLRSHAFFKSINWSFLAQKHTEPPYIPESILEDDPVTYDSFEDMVEDLGLKELMEEYPNTSGQAFFNTW